MGLVVEMVYSGLIVPEAYVRIEHYDGDKSSVNIIRGYYASKDAQRAGEPALKTTMYTYPLDISNGAPNILRQGYQHMKTNDPELADAIDDLDDAEAGSA